MSGQPDGGKISNFLLEKVSVVLKKTFHNTLAFRQHYSSTSCHKAVLSNVTFASHLVTCCIPESWGA